MVKDKLVGLQEQRRLADSRTGDPQKILDFYTVAIDQTIRLYQEMSNMDDGHLTYETRQLVGLVHATEALSREDALIALSGPNRILTEAQYSEFARSAGVQRFVYGTWVAPYLPAKDKAIYDALVSSPAWATQTRIEDLVISRHKAAPSGGVVLPNEIDQWQTARDQLRGPSTGLNVTRVQGLLNNSFGKAADLRHGAWWLAGASAAAVLFIVLLVLLTIRTVLRRTNTLRKHPRSGGAPAARHRHRAPARRGGRHLGPPGAHARQGRDRPDRRRGGRWPGRRPTAPSWCTANARASSGSPRASPAARSC
ncbi:nitrate- and nitrite sensing domain-containing protein [Yinghuangia aomiensis]